MRPGALVVILIASTTGLSARPLTSQQVLAQQSCEGSYQGMTLMGGLQLERWMTARTYRYYGAFRDPYGNLYELEVMTPDLAGGTGSTWQNGARHRETFINIEVFRGGFVVRTEDGIVVQYQCRREGDEALARPGGPSYVDRSREGLATSPRALRSWDHV